MMTLLVNLDVLDTIDPSANEDAYIADIWKRFCVAYEQSEQNKSAAYIKGSCNIRLGRTDPQAIQNMAANWNNTLIETMQKTMDELPDDTEDWPGADIIGQLADAAREVADDWSPYTRHGVYDANEFGNPYFTTVLSEENLNAITGRPEDWAIVSIFPE